MDEVYSPQHNPDFWHHLSKVPNYIAPEVEQIDYDQLFAQGIKHLVFDLDNTLVSFGITHISPKTRDFLIRLKARPEVKSLRIATNSLLDLDGIKAALGVPVVRVAPFSFKPLPSFYRRILRDISDPPGMVAMIGDKLIQDVWGANYVGMTTVLVQPLGKDNWIDQAFHVRWHERRLLRKYLPKHVETWF